MSYKGYGLFTVVFCKHPLGLHLWHPTANLHFEKNNTRDLEGFCEKKPGFQAVSELNTPILDHQGEAHDVYINILSQGWKPQHWHSEQWTQHILCLTMLYVLFSQDVFRRGSWKGKGGNVRWSAVYPLSASIWGQEHFFCVDVPWPTPLPLVSCYSTNYRKRLHQWYQGTVSETKATYIAQV